jgi:beta-lactamase regulating signal transducer with metallopeptidase domain
MSGLGVSTGAWLVHSAAGGGLLLLLVWGLVRHTRQPARQQRLGEWGVLAALLLTVLSLAPAWLVLRVPILAPTHTAAKPSEIAAPVPPAPDRADLPPGEERAEAGPDGSAGADALTDDRDNTLASAPGAPDAPSLPRTDPGQPASPPACPARAEDSPAAAETGAAADGATPVPFAGAAVLACLGLVYLLVAAGVLTRWLLAHLALWRLLRTAEPAPAAVAGLFAAALPGRRRPRLLVSHRLRVPVSCGLLRPTVVLPAALCQRLAALRWVFAHELTHLERHDPWTCLLFGVAQAVYFYLPWFWWLRRQVGLCQEFIADAAVASQEAAPEDYAQFLLSLTTAPVAPAGAASVAGRPSDLFRRVTMLLDSPGPVERRCPRLWSWTAAAGLVVLAILASGVSLQAVAAPVPAADDLAAAPAVPPAPPPTPTADAAKEPARADIPTPPSSPAPQPDAGKRDGSERRGLAIPPDFFERVWRAWQEAFANGSRPVPARAVRPGDGRLGVRVAPPEDDLADQLNLARGQGLVVEDVRPDSPAARAGLRVHDLLLTLDGKPVPTEVRRFARLVEELRADVPVDAVVLRKGKRQTLAGLVLPGAPPAGRPLPPRPSGPRSPAFAPAGGVTSVLHNGDRVTIHFQQEPVSITITGTMAGGEVRVAEVLVQIGGVATRYPSLDRVPQPYRGQARLLIELGDPGGTRTKARPSPSEQLRESPVAGR